jgi:hypothetical protein
MDRHYPLTASAQPSEPIRAKKSIGSHLLRHGWWIPAAQSVLPVYNESKQSSVCRSVMFMESKCIVCNQLIMIGPEDNSNKRQWFSPCYFVNLWRKNTSRLLLLLLLLLLLYPAVFSDPKVCGDGIVACRPVDRQRPRRKQLDNDRY